MSKRACIKPGGTSYGMVGCAFVMMCTYIYNRSSLSYINPLAQSLGSNAPSASWRFLGRVGGIELASPRPIGVLNSVVGYAIEDGLEAFGGRVGACVFPRLGGLAGPFPL